MRKDGKVQKCGQDVHLGMYATEKEAARAYDTALLFIRGPKAKTNVSKSR